MSNSSTTPNLDPNLDPKIKVVAHHESSCKVVAKKSCYLTRKSSTEKDPLLQDSTGNRNAQGCSAEEDTELKGSERVVTRGVMVQVLQSLLAHRGDLCDELPNKLNGY